MDKLEIEIYHTLCTALHCAYQLRRNLFSRADIERKLLPWREIYHKQKILIKIQIWHDFKAMRLHTTMCFFLFFNCWQST